MARGIRTWDDYFIPGTSVLRNLPGVTDRGQLQNYEEAQALVRVAELYRDPVVGRFDYEHMKGIHRRIFQDVYSWAGQERMGPVGVMTKSGPDVVHFPPGDPAAPMVAYAYYPAGAIAEAATTQYWLLAKENHLTGLPQSEFVGRLAEHWGELNTIHSFREGNTRSQFVFFSQLSENAGYSLDTEAFKAGSPLREEFVAARFYHQATTKTDRLASVLDKAISTPPPALQSAPAAEPTSALDQIRKAGRAAADQTSAAQRKAGLNITARPATRSNQSHRIEDSRTRDDGRER